MLRNYINIIFQRMAKHYEEFFIISFVVLLSFFALFGNGNIVTNSDVTNYFWIPSSVM